MNRAEQALSKATGIPLEELEFKNEVQIIRPSEALEAMREIAWEAWKKVVNDYEVHSINEKLERITFDQWFNEQVKEEMK